MSVPQMRSPAPRGNAGNGTHNAQGQHRSPNTHSRETPDFPTVYVASRYWLPLPIAAVIVRFAELAGALS